MVQATRTLAWHREIAAQRERLAREARHAAQLKKEVKLRKHTLVQVKAFLDEARPQQLAYNGSWSPGVWFRFGSMPLFVCFVVWVA